MKKLRNIRRAEGMTVTAATAYGGQGEIEINGWKGSVVWGNSEWDWEHVSVAPYDHSITPSWDDMCRLKDIFFDHEEIAIQLHPQKSEYVNMATNCLHLWRPTNTALLEELERL